MDVYTNNRQISPVAASAAPVRNAQMDGAARETREAPARASAPTPRSLEIAQTALTREVPNRNYQTDGLTFSREEDVSDQVLDRAFSEANRAIPNGAFRLSYGVHEATNRIMVGIYSSETGELVRELPPESRLDTYARISEFVGLLFDSSS